MAATDKTRLDNRHSHEVLFNSMITVRKNSRFSELRGATLGYLDPRLGFAPKNCEKSPDSGSTPN